MSDYWLPGARAICLMGVSVRGELALIHQCCHVVLCVGDSLRDPVNECQVIVYFFEFRIVFVKDLISRCLLPRLLASPLG